MSEELKQAVLVYIHKSLRQAGVTLAVEAGQLVEMLVGKQELSLQPPVVSAPVAESDEPVAPVAAE